MFKDGLTVFTTTRPLYLIVGGRYPDEAAMPKVAALSLEVRRAEEIPRIACGVRVILRTPFRLSDGRLHPGARVPAI